MDKINSSKVKDVFKNVGRMKGLEIWRIEKFEAVPWPKSEFGKFYTGDSYVILSTKETNGVLSNDIHYWIGNESTQDKYGAAAIYTVHLGDQLSDRAPQHRETQEHESSLFQSYFKKGIRYLDGGTDSGFNKVTTNAEGEPRLFRMKGKRNVRIRQVPLTIQSMNQHDYFLLDSGRKIFVYPPKMMNNFQKTKANEIAKQIRDQDHNGRASVHILDHPISYDDRKEFFGILGCTSSNPAIPDVQEEDDDDVIEMKENATITLYNATTKPGYFTTSTGGLLKISSKPLRQEMLKTDICSILDTGIGIFVWIGKEASTEDKALAMSKAQEFITANKYPNWTQLHRIVEGAEPVQFKQYFATWRESQQHRIQHKKIAGKDSVEFHPSTLHKKKSGRGGFMTDDNGKGNVELWRVQNRELVVVRQEMQGMFFDRNCYLIKYSALNKGGSVIYFWQGKHASVLDKGASAILTVNMAEKMESGAVQVLVNQGYEPRHFLKIFMGKFVISCGSAEEFLKNKDSGIKPNENRLFKIRGTNEYNVHAEQMKAVAASLASDDTFIMSTPATTYVWMGVGTSEAEKEMAKNNVERISPGSNAIIIQEGAEPPEFWKALGGKGDYDRELDKPGAPFLDTRLFHCKVRNDGKFVVREILNFYQDDLDIDDVFILDGGDEIYVWEGIDCSEEEKEKSMQLANTYIQTEPSARTPASVNIITIQQGNEPKSFKQLFPKWKNNFWK
ncbi:gelsolin-like isoform X1 [Bradysia coprophila]|uniref:gelsolin-like isoform X1 n=1 Tax=Bradysia coprophila TaxID=38358 RepID=UPI00187DD33E|nr:gelsolin-like isoform X1 [Bradysia coprophila]